MAKSQKSGKGKGDRKKGRNRNKKLRRTEPTSLYVRDKINFETYAKMAGIKSR